MPLVRKLLGDQRIRLAIAAAAVVLVAGAVIAWRTGFDRAALAGFWVDAKTFLAAYPWALFLALVLLPALPFPVSVLVIAAGVLWHDRPVWACLFTMAALSLNMTWTYWFAAGPARRFVEWMIRSAGFQIPALPRQDQVRLILVLRLTPGVPMFFQNYLLGIFRPPFRLYLLLSILLISLPVCGLVLVGAGATDGRLAPVLTGVSLVIVAIIVTRWLRGRVERRNAAKGQAEAAEE